MSSFQKSLRPHHLIVIDQSEARIPALDQSEASMSHCHDDTILTQTGGQPFLKINSRIVFENLTTVKTRARLLNRSLQVVELTPLLASQCQALNKKPRQNRLSCQKAVSSLLGARYFSRWCPISWPLPGSPGSHHHKSGGWDRDYFRRVKSENGLSDCQLRVLSSHLPSSQTIFSKLRILWILIRWRWQPASVAHN